MTVIGEVAAHGAALQAWRARAGLVDESARGVPLVRALSIHHPVLVRVLGLVFCSASVAANRLVAPQQYEGIVAAYRSTFEKAARMKVDIFLAPHTEFFDLPGKRAKLAASPSPNPFINPTEFGTFIAQQKAAFEVELKRQQDEAAARTLKPPTSGAGPNPGLKELR